MAVQMAVTSTTISIGRQENISSDECRNELTKWAKREAAAAGKKESEILTNSDFVTALFLLTDIVL
jgi:hypothetical protein